VGNGATVAETRANQAKQIALAANGAADLSLSALSVLATVPLVLSPDSTRDFITEATKSHIDAASRP
jgi:hypothetical protein